MIYKYLVGGFDLKKKKQFVPAIPLDSCVDVPQRFFQINDSVHVFDPPFHFRRVRKGSYCPGQLTLGGETL